MDNGGREEPQKGILLGPVKKQAGPWSCRRKASLSLYRILSARGVSQGTAQQMFLLARCMERLIWAHKRLGNSKNVLGSTQRKMQ